MINSIYKRGLKYLGMILQRYGLVERTPENEASSLLLRYARRPTPSFVLKDTVGEMYFCNLRCYCIWSVQLATRPNLSAEDSKRYLFADHSIG